MTVCIVLLFIAALILSAVSAWCNPSYRPLFILFGGSCAAACVLLCLVCGRSENECILIVLLLMTITALAEKRRRV